MTPFALVEPATATDPVTVTGSSPAPAAAAAAAATATDATDALAQLAYRIDARAAVVAVVGLGYVGLPLLLQTAREGFPVIGLDASEAKVRSLIEGRSYLVDVKDDELPALAGARITSDRAALADADVVIIAVPTPLTDGVPDLSLVRMAGEAVAASLRPGQLVVLESTTYPGTTEELLQPLLDATGLHCGVDYALGYSPERVDPGSRWNIATTPKVVSGVGERATRLVEAFYGHLSCQVVSTPTPREAEMAKLIENTFRQVNIALVNELATLSRDLNVDIWAALDAAATKPFGYLPFWPGPGVGGHCIAVDPSYLSWRAEQRLGYGIGFIQHATRINNRMPGYVVERVREALSDVGKPLAGARILAVGVSYKPGVNDIRESPALAVVQRLQRAGARIDYHDPCVPSLELDGTLRFSVELERETLLDADCVVLLAAGPDLDLDLLDHAPLVFDTQGITRHQRAPHIVLL